MARSLLRRWLDRLFTPAAGKSRPRRPSFRPVIEVLEDRITPSVAFGPQASFAVGNEPSSIAVADFNGDNKPDLVTVSIQSDTLSVLLNTTAPGATAPSFAAPVTFATGVQPTSVAVGDFNGDGKLDIAVTNYSGSSSVYVYLNTTPTGATVPSFSAPTTFAVSGQPVALVAGDFNGDHKTDLAFSDYNNGDVAVMLNQTTTGATAASFAAPVTFAVGNGPESMVVGDFNGDNKPDLAVVNNNDGTVAVLLDTTATGATTPSFAAPVTFAVGGNPIYLTTGDFNGDGRPDLVTVNNGDDTVSVLLDTTAAGATVPSFAAQQAFATGGQPRSAAVGDFNGDGKPDIVTTNNDDTIAVLLNATVTGATVPSFAPPQTFAGAFSVPVVTADFNGDGRTDVGLGSAVLPGATPVVTAQFGSQGVWEFSQVQNAWVQLTPANATLLADDVLGDVVGEFPGYGLWEYKPLTGTWTQVNATDVSALTMDALGDFAVTFPHYGVYEYRRGVPTPVRLNPSDAYLLATDAAGDVFADFRGYGLYELRAGMAPAMLNGTDVSLLSVNASGELVVDFPGYGVATYSQAAGWQTLTTHQAQALAIDALGDVAGSFAGSGGGSPANNTFPGVGTGVYHPGTGWTALPGPAASALGLSLTGDVFADFTGYGAYEFDPFRGWMQLPFVGADATLLVVA